jgi:hypothetical protein
VIREIVGYGSSDEEEFVVQLDLSPDRVAALRELVKAGDDTELVNVYAVEGRALELIKQWLGTELNPGLDYFLESSA